MQNKSVAFNVVAASFLLVGALRTSMPFEVLQDVLLGALASAGLCALVGFWWRNSAIA